MTDRHANGFVADSQIPPSPPPSTTSGPVGWLRENLFSGPVNTVLTLAALALVFWIVPGIIQWVFIDAVWHADSLEECRAINSDGACWAVIVQRFDQFIYGFYPQELRWRPDLAFGLLLVALAYVLFDNMPFRRVGLAFAADLPDHRLFPDLGRHDLGTAADPGDGADRLCRLPAGRAGPRPDLRRRGRGGRRRCCG